jgi:hypothetical protein
MKNQKDKKEYDFESYSDKDILKEILILSHKNREDIESIRKYMRRAFVSKIIYWLIIIVITTGAVYAASPYAKKAIHTYNSVKSNLEESSDAIEKPANLFKDIKLIKKIFEFNSK